MDRLVWVRAEPERTPISFGKFPESFVRMLQLLCFTTNGRNEICSYLMLNVYFRF